MSDLGDDLKEVHEEVGSAFAIVRDDAEISGEFCIMKKNSQVTKPFTREFFMECKFDWDTEIIAGDIVRVTDGRHFMVMNKTPAIYQNEAIEQQAVLYKCNVAGTLQRISGEGTYDAEYKPGAEFVTIKSDVYGLLTESLYNYDLETNEELALLGFEDHEFYVPNSVGIQIFDRFIPVSGETPLLVESIKKRRYDSVDVVTLSIDPR